MYIDDSGGLPAPATTMAGSSLRVTPDTVLAVRDAIQRAVDEANDRLQVEISRFELAPCAHDPVSLDVASAWNHRLVFAADSHANRINAYVTGLRDLVGRLTTAAEAYGRTELANSDMLAGRRA